MAFAKDRIWSSLNIATTWMALPYFASACDTPKGIARIKWLRVNVQTLQEIRYERCLLFTEKAILGEKTALFTLRMCETCCKRARMMSQGRKDAEFLNVMPFIRNRRGRRSIETREVEVASRYSNRA
jgi:hypothetical protein